VRSNLGTAPADAVNELLPCGVHLVNRRPNRLDRRWEPSNEYDQRRAAADELVESVGTDGVFEEVEERSME
jgi:hypothetical protein